jgi:hypothetical protein
MPTWAKTLIIVTAIFVVGPLVFFTLWTILSFVLALLLIHS